MEKQQLPPDFKEFLRLLNEYQVEYLLIGGHAVGYHGYPRSTGDMDIWIAMNQNNANKIVDLLIKFGFDTTQLSSSLFLEEDKIVRMGNPPLRIELLTTISGISFDVCYPERIVDSIDGVEVAIINLNHLKQNKRSSGRHKDLDDLEHL